MRSIKRYSRIFIATLILFYTGCSANLAIVHETELRELPKESLNKLQFYSGDLPIIFTANTDSASSVVRNDVLQKNDYHNEFILTIPPETPGILDQYITYRREWHIWFGENLPPLIYKEYGQGLVLISEELVVDGITYTRFVDNKATGFGNTGKYLRNFLKTRIKTKTKDRTERRKISGIKVKN